jgi:hypothetical protein
MIEITIQGKSMIDVIEQVGDTLKNFVSTDTLVDELRRRMTTQGMEVIISRVDGSPRTTDEAIEQRMEEGRKAAEPTEAPKRGPGRPRKTPEAEPVNEAPKAAKSTNGKVVETPTREEVIEALDAYAKNNGGQAAGREIMKKVTGAVRLIDCDPTKYGALIKALTG